MTETSCQVVLAGSLSATARRALHAQYDVAVTPSTGDSVTLLDLEDVDQAAMRGLLTLLWDFGVDVLAVSNQPKEHTP
jgi:hypothetical protein